MFLSSDWIVSYSNRCLESPKFHYQILSSKTFFLFYSTVVPGKKNLITKHLLKNILSDAYVYKSIYHFEAITNVE